MLMDFITAYQMEIVALFVIFMPILFVRVPFSLLGVRFIWLYTNTTIVVNRQFLTLLMRDMARFFLSACLSFFLCLQFPFLLVAIDSLFQGQSISISQTIVSAGGVFEFGFFNPVNSSNYYVGLWYKKIPTQTVVWVGNRNVPVTSSSALLTIKDDGNLAISFDRVYYIYTITNVSAVSNTSLTLLDSGNLVLKDSNSVILWESFNYPTDTFLPGMKIGFNKRSGHSWSFISWRSTEDPGIGEFTLELESAEYKRIIIMDGSQRYWTGGAWNGTTFDLVPEAYTSNFSYISNENESYYTYSLIDPSLTAMFIMDETGQFKKLTWSESLGEWNLFWSAPKTMCDGLCGPFAICTNLDFTYSRCQCMEGFIPRALDDRRDTHTSTGCVRRTPLQCKDQGAVNGDEDKFLKMTNLHYENFHEFVEGGIKECRLACLKNCSCSAYAFDDGDGCFLWFGDLMNMQQTGNSTSQHTIYLKLAASELPASGKKKLAPVVVPTVVSLIVLCLASYACYRWRTKNRETGQDILHFDIGATTYKSDQPGRKASSSGTSNDPEMPFFSFKSVSAATHDFSCENKLGEGGFGPVYKGKLLNGQEIAVKRLSKKSSQGFEELKNEAVLIAKLQHTNLVKFLGCCLEKRESILVYEYLPNKSLDLVLFDPDKKGLLNWDVRVRIIEGIAQGLLYLHHYSRLRIIHRDLKASNILLDTQLNPKISDFGIARIFRGDHSQSKTKHIVGTYGYMPPEYALHGLFSIKSDVFSYGVLLLEITSGKKNGSFHQSNSLNLLGHAWDLWNCGKVHELIDPSLEDEYSKKTLVRYINVGLLCVQENAADRPRMFEVVSMLINEAVFVPSPKQPAFSNFRSLPSSNPECERPEYSVNVLTATVMDTGR